MTEQNITQSEAQNQTTDCIRQTKQWLSTVVIKYTLCPFVEREFLNNRIHYEVINEQTLEAQLECVIMQCLKLDNDTSIETSLLIFPETLKDFDDYLDLYEIANECLDRQGFTGRFQLASFHPQYCFADSTVDDASNYTNRSPYPMLHILREESVEKALENHPNPEGIPERNIDLTRKLGLNTLQNLLSQCYQ